MKEYRVGLDDVRFYGYHGLFSEERVLGNWFVISVQVTQHVDSFTFTHLDQTLDYGVIYSICEKVMLEPEDLLETVASKIAGQITQRFGRISGYEIHVRKEQPPLGMTSGRSRVSLIENFNL